MSLADYCDFQIPLLASFSTYLDLYSYEKVEKSLIICAWHLKKVLFVLNSYTLLMLKFFVILWN